MMIATPLVAYLSITYLVGILWFMILERKDGYVLWRLFGALASPIAVPLMASVAVFLFGMDLVIKIKNRWF